MFLVRSIFWLGVVVMILPPAADGSPPPRVSLLEAISAAQIFANDIAGTCERNPRACEIGNDTVTLVGKKARTGMEIVGSIISTDTHKAESGTLTDEDLLAKWSAGGSE